jgi:aminomethyltransferase
MSEPTESLKTTPLNAQHRAMGARMVPFGGYDMPVQFKDGVLTEHKWTRAHAGVFDVSHMGPAMLSLTERSGDAEADHAAISALIEPLISGDIASLKPGQIRYTILLNEEGGMLDDLMVGRYPTGAPSGSLYIVVNAGTKDDDYALIAEAVGDKAKLMRMDGCALIAVQGPEAAAVVADILPGAADLGFMQFSGGEWQAHMVMYARSGYTGEDGYEILVPPKGATAFYDRLLADERAKPIGLGARDSLRLEAGLPLYGHDADPTVSPIEAGLNFAVPKKRRERGDLRGGARIVAEFGGALKRVRIGLRVLEGAPAREGAEIADGAGKAIGVVTSGGFSPSLGQAIAMGFVPPDHAAVGTRLNVIVRGKAQAAEVVAMPFVPHRYVRKP